MTVDIDPTDYAYGRLPEEEEEEVEEAVVEVPGGKEDEVDGEESAPAHPFATEDVTSFVDMTFVLQVGAIIAILVGIVGYARHRAKYRAYKALEEEKNIA